jgi:hypothetical protein
MELSSESSRGINGARRSVNGVCKAAELSGMSGKALLLSFDSISKTVRLRIGLTLKGIDQVSCKGKACGRFVAYSFGFVKLPRCAPSRSYTSVVSADLNCPANSWASSREYAMSDRK